MPEAYADLIIYGRIATLRGTDGFGQVEALAIRAGRVVGWRASSITATGVPNSGSRSHRNAALLKRG